MTTTRDRIRACWTPFLIGLGTAACLYVDGPKAASPDAAPPLEQCTGDAGWPECSYSADCIEGWCLPRCESDVECAYVVEGSRCDEAEVAGSRHCVWQPPPPLSTRGQGLRLLGSEQARSPATCQQTLKACACTSSTDPEACGAYVDAMTDEQCEQVLQDLREQGYC